MQFINEKMEYKPRVLKESEVEDFVVLDEKNIWTLTASGTVQKLKSLMGRT